MQEKLCAQHPQFLGNPSLVGTQTRLIDGEIRSCVNGLFFRFIFTESLIIYAQCGKPSQENEGTKTNWRLLSSPDVILYRKGCWIITNKQVLACSLSKKKTSLKEENRSCSKGGLYTLSYQTISLLGNQRIYNSVSQPWWIGPLRGPRGLRRGLLMKNMRECFSFGHYSIRLQKVLFTISVISFHVCFETYFFK